MRKELERYSLGCVSPKPEVIRTLRQKRGWSQLALAQQARVGKRTIEGIEKGKPKRPSSMLAVARALGVPVSTLVAVQDVRPSGWENARPLETLSAELPADCRQHFLTNPFVEYVPLGVPVADYITVWFQSDHPVKGAIKLQVIRACPARPTMLQFRGWSSPSQVGASVGKRVYYSENRWPVPAHLRPLVPDPDERFRLEIRESTFLGVAAHYSHDLVSSSDPMWGRKDWIAVEVEDVQSEGPVPYRFAIGRAGEGREVRLLSAWSVGKFALEADGRDFRALFLEDTNPRRSWAFSALPADIRAFMQALARHALADFVAAREIGSDRPSDGSLAAFSVVAEARELDLLCKWSFDLVERLDRDRLYITSE